MRPDTKHPVEQNSTTDAIPGACESCSRRSFLAGSALFAVSGILLAACGDGQIGGAGTAITGLQDSVITLADYPALSTNGGIARISGLSSPVAVVRQSPSSYHAFSLVCPHQGTTVSVVNGGFRCPNHDAQFNASGTWVGGQRTSSLRQIGVTLDEAAGTITLGGLV